MLAAWFSGKDGNLFPLYRSTAFKVTSEESINKHHSVGTCRSVSTYKSEQILLQNSRSFLERKIN
jgi:hypothetical protein